MSCTDSMLYESLKFCKGNPVPVGIRTHVYAISKDDIVKWPELPSTDKVDAKTLDTLAQYTGDFTLSADKKWLRIDLLDKKGKLEWEISGTKPNVLFLNKITLNHPLYNASAAAFQRMAVADDLAYLVPQRDGKYRVVGCEAYETTTKPSGSTGEGIEGEAGSNFEIEAPDVCPAPFYAGKIETEAGNISGATDTSIVTTP